MMDMSELLGDVDFCDTFDVIRRPAVNNNFGENVVTPSTIKGVVGVVCATGHNDLNRTPDMQFTPRVFNVVTNFQLRAMWPGGQPDIVVWNGDQYVVRSIRPYPRFGAGFVQAAIESMDAVDVNY